MNRGLACLALAGLAALPRALGAQSAASSVPDALKESALAVRVFAIVPAAPAAGLKPPDSTSPDADGQPAPPTSGTPPSPGVQSPSPAAQPPSPTAQGSPQGGQNASVSSAKDKASNWRQVEGLKYTVPGTPVPFKFVGGNLVVLVQVTPFIRRGSQGLVLVTQGQVWIADKNGGISYRTAINTLSVNYGEKVFFFPLGVDGAGKAPLRVEIDVLRAADLKAEQAGPAADDKGGGADKSVPGDKPAAPGK